MKVFDCKDKEGKLLSFEISNIGRKHACSVLKGNDSIQLIRKPKFFSYFRESIFCEFNFLGIRYAIEEPFGDNSRYLVYPQDNVTHPETEIIKELFSKYLQ